MPKILTGQIKPATAGHQDEPIVCGALVGLSPLATGEMMYMPGGIQTINPIGGGIGAPIKVLINASSAGQLNAQLAALKAQNKRPYFDLGHKTDGPASFWPASFVWSESPEPGIYARGEWTSAGRAAIEGKEYRQFSPVFHVDNKRANPAKIVCRDWAHPDMGGIVNDPAFHNILPLWARDAAGAHPSGNQNQNADSINMTPEQLAALQAKITDQETEITALKARETAAKTAGENTALVASEIRAAQSELNANKLGLENAALKASAKTQGDAITARNLADAKTAVAAAVARGAIAPKNEAAQQQWEALICQDAANAVLLAGLPGAQALEGRITASAAPRVTVVGMSGPATLKEMSALIARQSNASTMQEKVEISKDAAAIYARISGTPEFMDMPISAADVASADLGTLAGTLVSMRTIEDYEQQLIDPRFITTDYSDMPAQFGQTTVTRIVVVPAIESYNGAAGADGRPIGYVVTTPAKTVDAPVTLNQHKAVEVVFSTEQLGSTVRNLFGEQENLQGYALALEVNAALLANITLANFPGVGPTDDPMTIGTLSQVISLQDFGRAAFADAAAGMNPIGVPIPGRCCLMNSTYFGRLSQDPTLVSLAVFQKPEIITGAELPAISKFQPLEASYLPGVNNLAAFFMHRSALVIQTRVPVDYTKALPGSSFGNVSVITGKGGVSFLRVAFVDHKGAYAASRLALMYGTGIGNAKGGKFIASK